MKKTIEDGKWWDAPWTLVNGCTPVSPACDNCWLAEFTHRHSSNPTMKGQFDGLTEMAGNRPCFNGKVTWRPDRLDVPRKTKKPTVFAVWSDLLHEKIPTAAIDMAFNAMHQSPEHTFIVLTKRAARMARVMRMLSDDSRRKFHNVYMGVTAENQEQAEARILELLRYPGKKILSIEPLLGPIDLTNICLDASTEGNEGDVRPWVDIDGVIVGGETGHNARPMHIDWVRQIQQDCKAAGVPFFFKGWGGRNKSRELDGVVHNALPWGAE